MTTLLNRGPRLLALAVLVACAFALVSACSSESAARIPPVAAPRAPAAEPAAPTPASTTPSAAAEDDARDVVIQGDLRPSEAAELSFKAGGQLASRRAARGDRVKSGQVLAQLSDTEAQAQLAQAEAAVGVARAQAAIAEDQAQRAQSLRTQDAAPAAQAIAAGLQAEAARAGVRQGEAAIALARANVANHVLRAPFDGVVTRAPDGTGGTYGPGYPVYRLEKLDPLLLSGTVVERAVDRLAVGAPVTVETAVGPVTGTLRAVVRSLEPVSRRIPVEVLVPNADGRLVAGAYVRARAFTAPVPAPASLSTKEAPAPEQGRP